MTQFNTQQRQAIEALGKNVVVSASAGAGKTTVLIERLMKRILRDGVSIDRICALTFTEAAAGEMKKRLLAALYAENQANPSDYLTQQMMLVETAKITTIHSFCLSLIKDHGYRIGITDAYTQNILDPAMVSLYQDQALTKTLETWAALYPERLKVLINTFSSRPQDISSLKTNIRDVAQYIGSKHNPDATTQMILDTYAATKFDALPQTVQASFYTHHLGQLTFVEEALQKVIQTLDILDEAELTALLLAHLGQIQEAKACVMHQDISFVDRLPQILDIKLKTLRKAPDYKDAGDALAKVIGTYLLSYSPQQTMFQTLNQQAPLVATVLEISSAYQEEFRAIKKSVRGLDFDDFERIAYQLLTQDDGALASELSQSFDEIMVDEFQDTNDYQDAILQLISNGHNIFRVGDVKQSIYRFRGAKPSIMQNLMKDASVENISLSFNYRSKESIVFYNNDLFEQLLALTDTMTYTDADHVDTGVAAQKIDSVPVEFLLVTDPEDKNDLPIDTLPWDKSRHMRKARVIASEVIRHHEMGYRFKDMVILVRSHQSKVFLKRAFEEANIPHFIDDRGGFYKSSAVASLLAFFNYYRDRSDYTLAHVLLSPFIGYSHDQLATLRLQSSEGLLKGLQSLDPRTYETLVHFRSLWGKQDVLRCILDVINLNQAYHSRLSIQDKTNIDALMEKAITYQGSNNPTLDGFIDYVKNLEDSSDPEAIPLSDADDVVTSMTIHQSKGLQFPVVIVWSLGARRNRDVQGSIITDDALGIAITDKVSPQRVKRDSILKSLMKSKQDREDLEETLRLVYVALTRPQARLVIIDQLKSYTEQSLDTSLLYGYSSQIELLLSAHSAHSTSTITCYDSIPFKILDPVETQDTHIPFKALPLFEVENTPIDHGQFEFNPNFIQATNYGTRLHNAVEKLPARTWSQIDLMEIPEALHETLTTYNQDPFTQELYMAPDIQQEMPFTYRTDAAIHNGIIDAYYRYEDHLVIVDFKTDNTDLETLKSRYAQQLSVYKEALRTLYPDLDITCYLYSFHNHCYLEL